MGQTETFAYDNAGQVETSEYDNAGRLVRATDRNGSAHRSTYDALLRHEVA